MENKVVEKNEGVGRFCMKISWQHEVRGLRWYAASLVVKKEGRKLLECII